MRTSGFITGSSGLGALALSDLGAPALYSWILLFFAFLGLVGLFLTTVRPDLVRAIRHRLNSLSLRRARPAP